MAAAQDPQTGEYLIKAAFLYNFAKFVEWPETQDVENDLRSSVILGILGNDPFGKAIETIQGKTVKGKKLRVKHFSRVEDLESCHMLFICSSERQGLIHVLNRVNGSNVLTVGDMHRFAQLGGMVNLVKEGNKIKFEINVNAVRKAGLKISSKLLKLARIVENH